MVSESGTVFTVLVPLRSSFAAHSARKMIRDVLVLHGSEADFADTAELCAGELINNAYEHSKADYCWVSVKHDDARGQLIFAVQDQSLEMPVTTEAAETEEHGRGMFIVAAMARDHGAYQSSDGKTVWFSLAIEQKPPKHF